MKMVVLQGLLLTLSGLSAGIAAGMIFARIAASLLVSTGFADHVTFAAASLLLGTVALIASYVPARRAARVDPIVTLRHQ